MDQDHDQSKDSPDVNSRGRKYSKAPAKPKDGSELAKLSREEAGKAVFAHAGRLLSIKDWSQSDMAARLGERFGKAPEGKLLAEEAAERMREIGALDDARFARGFLRSKLAKRSQQTALRELYQHGVGKDDAAAAIEELRAEGLIAEPADQAYLVWSKKFSGLPQDERERSKQSRFMASRGFSFEAIKKVWAQAKREAAGE